MGTQPILLIQTGSAPDDILAPHGDLDHWFQQALGPSAADGGSQAPNLAPVQVVRVFAGEALPAPGRHRVAIITGSWAMVTDRLGWSEATAAWIREAMRIDMPLFGVCYGHQLMAHALGGTVDYHPAGIEIGCLPVERLPAGADDPLAATLPERFPVHLTHMQSVLVPPPGAQVLARSAQDAHQMLRYGPKAVSTQFHPEFTPAITAACITRREAQLRDEGHDPDALLARLSDTAVARGLLRDFVTTHAGLAPTPVARVAS